MQIILSTQYHNMLSWNRTSTQVQKSLHTWTISYLIISWFISPIISLLDSEESPVNRVLAKAWACHSPKLSPIPVQAAVLGPEASVRVVMTVMLVAVETDRGMAPGRSRVKRQDLSRIYLGKPCNNPRKPQEGPGFYLRFVCFF